MVNFALILSAAPLLVSALPSFSPSHDLLPRDAHKVAFDEVNRRLIAFDRTGRDLGSYPLHARFHSMTKRAAGNCVPLSSDEAQALKGFQLMKDEAKKEWGDGSHNIVTNDKDFPDSPAQVCDFEGAQFTYDDSTQKSCHESTNKAEGTLEDGKIILQNDEGQTFTGTTTVTKASKLGISEKVSASFKFPEIADFSAEITTTQEITNENSQATTIGENHVTTQRIEQPVDANSTDCSVQLTTKNCQITATGTMNMVAQGTVWFEFDDKVDGHFKWALDIASIITNEGDRSEPIEFKHVGESSTMGHFSSTGCTSDATAQAA